MIRVAFLLPHMRPGGAERCVVNWIGALDRARFAPVLMLTRQTGAFLDLVPGDVPRVSLGGGRAALLPRRIAATLSEHRIHVAYSATNAMNLALLAAGAGASAIVSEHTPPAAYLAEAKWPVLRRAAMRRLYPRAAAVAVPTDRIGGELAAVLARPLRLATVPNPVAGGVAAQPSPRRSAGPLRLLSAGRLVPAKGFDLLVEACRLAVARGLDCTLEICGDGEGAPAIAAQIAAAGLAERVTLSGHSDLPARLAAADLFVLASRREGFGNVLVEAMATGTPVLATRAGGPETFIDHGRNGFLVEAGRPDLLAEALVALADPARRAAVVAPGLETARGYAIAPSTRRLEALFASVAAVRSTAA